MVPLRGKGTRKKDTVAPRDPRLDVDCCLPTLDDAEFLITEIGWAGEATPF